MESQIGAVEGQREAREGSMLNPQLPVLVLCALREHQIGAEGIALSDFGTGLLSLQGGSSATSSFKDKTTLRDRQPTESLFRDEVERGPVTYLKAHK